MRKTLLMILLAILLIPLDCYARTYSITLDRATPEQAVEKLKETTGLNFMYQKDVLKIAKSNVTCSYSGLTIEQLLNRVISVNMRLAYEKVDNTVVIKVPDMDVDFVKGSITGVVLDAETNEPLVGATVVVEGTTKAVMTGIDGKFTINDVEALNPFVSVFYVGMQTVAIRVTPKIQHALRFEMQSSVTTINEVVVTGYADVSKEKMTGATTTISAEKLENRYSTNLVDNLEGRVAGLSTYGGKPIIRGIGTLNGSSQPLLVIDGLPVEGGLDDLNFQDIESVNVLKDAAASAIYGARAANGIIVVTTKNAKKKGKIEVDFSTNITLYENKNMDYHDNFYMTPEEHIKAECDYMEYKYFTQDGYKNNPILQIAMMDAYMAMGFLSPSPIDYAYYQLATGQITRDKVDNIIDSLRGNNYARDYANAIYRRQVIQQYNLSLRSSSDISTNNIVVNYKHDNSGIINHSDDWINISYKGTFNVAKWLSATFSINSILSNKKEYGDEFDNIATNPFYFAPYYSFYNSDGSRKRYYGFFSGNEFALQDPAFYDLSEDPVEEMFNNTRKSHRQNMRYHANLLFKIIPGLTANAQFIYETDSKTIKNFATDKSHAARLIRNAYTVIGEDGKYTYLTPRSGGFLQSTQQNSNAWTARGQLNYQKGFGKHDISVIAGMEFRETSSKVFRSLALGYDDQLQSSATHTVDFGKLSQIIANPYYMAMVGGFPSNQFAFDRYLKDGIGLDPDIHHRYASGYANATYTYDSRYNLFGSFRKDYADVFGLNSKFRGKPLWSVGFGWNIHNESFMQNLSTWINFLKLRFSYGVTGNIYQGATSVMTASAGQVNDYTNQPYGTVTSPANPDLRWEQNRTTNVGIDFNLLNFRLRGSIDYYNKDGKDIFNGLNLDPTTGFNSIVANAASIRNNGVEIAASYYWFLPTAKTDFSWTTSLTFTYNHNEVKKVENPSILAYQLINNPYKIGYPVNALWSYRFAGISDVEGEEGMNTYYTEDGTPNISVDSRGIDVLHFSGQSDPKYITGMDNTLRWKGLSLSIVLAYYGGHKMRAIIYNQRLNAFEAPVGSYFNNAWTPENRSDMPGLGKYASSFISGQDNYADRSVRDASFLKIRNIVLGYTLPDSWLRPIGAKDLQLRFQINNLKALWTANDLGVDPETLGIRQPASYTIGLNVNF